MWDSADWRAVVFVSDRVGRPLRARERCLQLAGIPWSTVSERRPSGTYYKLCVREQDAVNALLALRLGGFCRSVRLRSTTPSFAETVIDAAWNIWDDAMELLGQVVELVRTAPRLLSGPARATAGE
jgi:hypothetical protein